MYVIVKQEALDDVKDTGTGVEKGICKV
jgi:hypothetical protein